MIYALLLCTVFCIRNSKMPEVNIKGSLFFIIFLCTAYLKHQRRNKNVRILFSHQSRKIVL